MKKIFLLLALVVPTMMFAQNKEAQRIIITKKGSSNEKVNITIDGENVTVNGKPLTEDADGDITIKRIKIKDLDNYRDTPPEGSATIRSFGRIPFPTNKAMLGVATEKNDKGAKIVSVNEESAAEKAGLKEGDIIEAVDSKKITTPDELSQALKDKEPGDKVEITYSRDGKKNTVTATLTKWKAPQTMTFEASPNFDLRDFFGNVPNEFGNGNRRWEIQTYPRFNISSGPKLGIKIQDLEAGSGVKVIEVEKDSDAEKAGLKEGDIIKEMDGHTINGTDDMIAQTRKNKPGANINVKVDRKGRTENIKIQLSKKIKSAHL